MQQDIQCLRLDEVMAPDLWIDLMKLDVERHEYQVLLGAGELISKQVFATSFLRMPFFSRLTLSVS